MISLKTIKILSLWVDNNNLRNGKKSRPRGQYIFELGTTCITNKIVKVGKSVIFV